MTKRLCEYKNCGKEITGRKDKRYCCRLHKQSQRKVRLAADKKAQKV